MKTMIFLFFIMTSLQNFAQEKYWQQELKYNIDVSLNDKENSLTGFETVLYKNNAPTSLDFIWFHIWPNAYKNDQTALFQQLRNDETRKSKLASYKNGSIDGLAFKINGKEAKVEAHPDPRYIDVIKLVLPEALKTGDSVTITTPFKVMLPSYFSRSGYADGEFMICQWYPKPAVFDKDGWHEIPYLDMGEFYSEYGSYTVNISLPSSYVVSATGSLQNQEELMKYKEIGSKNVADLKGKRVVYSPSDKAGTKMLSYYAENVPDFAWFADKDFIIQYDTVKLSTGKIIDAFSFYHDRNRKLWNSSMDYIKDAVRSYTDWVGEYGYPVVQAVEGPKNNSSGGMEYPMVTLITSPDSKPETLDAVITHEIGHNWFMSMLGTNERMHTWMDEGLNSYFQFRYEAEKYRSNSVFGAENIPKDVKALPVADFQNALYQAISQIPMEPAIETPADKFASSNDYGLISYVKAAVWIYLLEVQVGREKIDKAFHLYFDKWKNKHPQPEDLKAAFEESFQVKLDDYFQMINKKGNF